MACLSNKVRKNMVCKAAMIGAALFLGACTLTTGKVSTTTELARPAEELEIQDLSRIPQRFGDLTRAAGNRLTIDETCRRQLHAEFKQLFFAPWTSPEPIFDPKESKKFMKEAGASDWYGFNKRRVPRKLMQTLLDNCALSRFPSRNDAAIAVAPGHLRGLPTHAPLYKQSGDEPFDMLSYPHVKLNEPLRVLHASHDGVWLFVETGSSNGWLEARDVALVDRAFIQSRMQAPQLVIVRDFTPVGDGKGVGTFPAKIGTILPLSAAGNGWWEVSIASAGEGGKAELRPSRIPRDAASAFPLEFSSENIALVGDRLLEQPYGWGEIYDMRDCSALLRDFFLPFGIWLPRTSGDQIASVGSHDLTSLAPADKQELIVRKGIPFLSLLHKPGHIMLYVGTDAMGRPLVFHDAWSIRVKDDGEANTEIIGVSAITTLEPGKELGLMPGSSLLERVTELGIITERCRHSSR
jgi:hypothetical protein